MDGETQFGKRQRDMHVVVGVLVLVMILALFPSGIAHADEDTKANPEYEQAMSNLSEITDNYITLAQKQDETLAQLQQKRDEIAANESKMDGVCKKIEVCQAELKTQQEVLAKHISDSYKAGGVSLLSILLSSSSWEDAVSLIYYHQAINKAEMSEIDAVNKSKSALQDQQDELKDLQTQLKDEEASLSALYDDQQRQTAKMEEQQQAAAALLQSIPQETKEQLDNENKEIIDAAEQVVQNSKEETSEAQADQQKEETPKEENKEEQKEEKPVERERKEQQPSKPVITGNGTLQAVLDSAYSSYPSDEAGRRGWGCSGYIYFLFQQAGINAPTNNASGYTNAFCYSSDRKELKPGMIVGVTTHTRSSAGAMNGHVGLYVGNNTVRDFGSSGIGEWSLDSWIAFYGTTVAVRWGWYGGVALS